MHKGRISPHGNSGISSVGVGSMDDVAVGEGVADGVDEDAGVGVGDTCGCSEL